MDRWDGSGPLDSLGIQGEGGGARAQGWRGRVVRLFRRPSAFALFGIALVGLLALIYLNEVSGVTRANAELRDLQATQTRLEREDAAQRAKLGTVTSPAFVAQRARELGLQPGDPAGVVIVTAGGGGQP